MLVSELGIVADFRASHIEDPYGYFRCNMCPD